MVFLNNLSRHSEWRKVAKKSRRKRIRQDKARERDRNLLAEQQRIENLSHYQTWLQEQERIEEENAKEEAIQTAQREEQWRKVEEEAQKQWQELQKKIALAREEKMKQNMKIKLEWEKEQQRLKEIQIAKEEELEEKRLQQAKREKELLDFLEQGGDTPEHLKTTMETNPGKQSCPFFQKVSACRFFDVCSRNHVRPGISKTLLISNFFTDMSLEIKENEHGSDSSLEFEKEDTYKHYREFFDDVVLELERCGTIKRFLTCCNHEAHLRGNVYVQYRSTREALISYHKFNGRWYAGKQLNVEFCNIDSWNNAVCGMFFRNKCPRGNACNFLHVFRNPRGSYMHCDLEGSRRGRRTGAENVERTSSIRGRDDMDVGWGRDSSERKHWRWSESPERERLPRREANEEEENRHRGNCSSRRKRSGKIRSRRDPKEYKPDRSVRRSRARRSRSRSNSRRRSRSSDDRRRSRSRSPKATRRNRRRSSTSGSSEESNGSWSSR